MAEIAWYQSPSLNLSYLYCLEIVMKVSLTVLCCCFQEALSAHKALVQEQAVLGNKLENFKVNEEKGISFQINIYLYSTALVCNEAIL